LRANAAGGVVGKLTAIVLVLLAAVGPRAHAAEIKVFTARAGATVLQTIGPEFERASGNKLNIITGFGPRFVERIDSGESFDILITGTPIVDGLIKSGKLLADSRIDLIHSGMGLEVRAGAPKPDIATVAALKQALRNAKSIGYIKPNRVGELIERLGMTDELKSKITVPDSDIVSELVAKGELEIGIVVLTQILTTPGVELVGPLPPDIQYSFQFTGAVSAQSKAPAAARDLLKFFAAPTAMPVIKSQGMEPG
jgi:molybdate transport system substrate-binding protein